MEEFEEDSTFVKYHKDAKVKYKHSLLKSLIPRMDAGEFIKGETYRAALLEFIGTTIINFMSIIIVVVVLKSQLPYPPLWIALMHVFLFTFVISSTIPPSGGHLNPLISLATTFCQVISVSRCIIYIVSQTTGAILASYTAKFIVGEEISNDTHLGACSFGELNLGQAFALEIIFDFFLLFISFGMVLDPHQGEVIGPIFGPFVVGMLISFNILLSGSLFPELGYSGAGMNPTRCFGVSVATQNFDRFWVYWVSALIVTMFHGVLYILVPPYHETLYGKLAKMNKKKDPE